MCFNYASLIPIKKVRGKALMLDLSETKIIIAQTIVDVEKPKVSPFHPQDLSDIFNKLIIHGNVHRYDPEEPKITFFLHMLKQREKL